MLRGGRVVGGTGVRRADVRISGGVIVSVGPDEAVAGDDITDVSGKFILPGGVDAHTHFDLPLGDGTRSDDDFASGTRSAIAGGTTCVIDYATQFRGESLNRGLDNWHGLADGRCFCDYSFHLAVTDWNGSVADELPGVMARGVTSFKMYMAYKGALQVDDGVLYEALRRLEDLGGLLCVHCENGDIISALSRELLRAGKTGPEHHPASRPEELEAEATGRLLVIASLAGAPVYVVHVSSGASIKKILEARSSGQTVFAETCPQYLYLDDSLYSPARADAAKYVCSPPLRDGRNHAEMWSALSKNIADVVATDHCSFNFNGRKDRHNCDFTGIPNGLPGVGSRMMLLYLGVARGLITMPQMARLASENPARIFGIHPGKGSITPGADADIVVLDPDGKSVITAETQFQNVDYTPYEGWEIPCRIESTYLRGERVFHMGRFLPGGPRGRFVRRRAAGVF
ncbi:MAG: dihydropyrimidinase [Synergistaceae bacterium]|nr:dihydropyrimidinase [Synergistaceae bacterium]